MIPQRTFDIWRTFLFHKRIFVSKWRTLEWFFVELKWFFYGIAVKNLLSTFIFKSVVYKNL